MRKITEKVSRAFFAGEPLTTGNTGVTVEGDSVRMYLHANLIAHKNRGALLITLAGWPTPTTRERLNGLLEIGGYNERVWQRGKEFCDNCSTGIVKRKCEKCTFRQWIGFEGFARQIGEHEVIRLD